VHSPIHRRLLLAGGGLQGALIALAVLEARPEADIVLLERSDRIGGNHTWSFHAGDVPASMRRLVDGISEHRWPDYDVRFPERSRRVALGYASISSAHLADIVQARLAAAPRAELRTACDVEHVAAHHVRLANGERIDAGLVVDARGAVRDPRARCGYQKFFGVELETSVPHGLERPCVMDATVEQVDGFRFLYLLPFSPTRLLVEDTVFSTRPDLDADAWRTRVLAEAALRGFTPAEVVREEQGVLPMPWSGAGPELQEEGPLRAGYRGRYFHPATGFSFPQALRLAELVANHADAPGALFASEDYARLVRSEQRQARFARFLNRLLFTGVSPSTRWTVFQRFYGQPESVMARFYAGQLTATDRARMLVGKPPRGFSVVSALAGRAIA
jgi:lycopene beta-cyclase